jgi:hypothetical protein
MSGKGQSPCGTATRRNQFDRIGGPREIRGRPRDGSWIAGVPQEALRMTLQTPAAPAASIPQVKASNDSRESPRPS